MSGEFAACPDCGMVFEAITQRDANVEVDFHLSETDCERRAGR